MAVERKFISEVMKNAIVERYIQKELSKVGCGDIDVKRTPLGTRIVINAIKPGLVIGRKGKNIQMLTEALKAKFDIENPQLEVQEVAVPEFDPKLMAQDLTGMLERGIHFRRAAYSMVQRIMDKGALGAQITISGKISGTRARVEKFKSGFIKHCGKTAELYIMEACSQAFMKQGALGIKVKIAPPAEIAEMLKLKDIVDEQKEAAEKKDESKEEKKEDKEEKQEKKEEKPDKKEVKEEKPAKKEEKPAKKKEEKKPAEKKDKKESKPKKAVKKASRAKKESKPKKEAKNGAAKKK